MNNLIGWLKLFRKVQANEIYFGEPFDKFHAWIDILINVDPYEHDVMTKKGVVHLQAGQGLFSEEELAERWRWSRNKVRRFLGTLNRTESVSVNGTRNGTIITVVKWEFYQSGGTANDTANDTTDGTLIKNKKNKKNQKNARARVRESENDRIFAEFLELVAEKERKEQEAQNDNSRI